MKKTTDQTRPFIRIVGKPEVTSLMEHIDLAAQSALSLNLTKLAFLLVMAKLEAETSLGNVIRTPAKAAGADPLKRLPS